MKRIANWESTLNLPKTAFPLRPLLNDHVYSHAISVELYEAQRILKKEAPVYTITDGPPFANGSLHVGINYSD